MLINSNHVWIWGIIQICKIFARLWQFLFLLLMCYSFLLMTRSLWYALIMPSFRNASKSYSLCGLSIFSKSVWSIPKWLSYFLSYIICFIRTLRLLSKSLRKVVAFERKVRLVTQKIFVDFHFTTTQFFTECFFSVHITQHNGNYRIIPFHQYVLCIGILLCWHAKDVMFWGYQSHFGTQKNYATGT